MSKFVSDSDYSEIDIGDGDWVRVPKRLSFGFVEKYGGVGGTDMEKTAQFVSQVIKSWNLKEEDGTDAPVTIENVRRLDMETCKLIVEKATEMLFNFPKGGSPLSSVPSADAGTTLP